MTLFLTMLPFYILGNLHCLGMCGPLVVMLGRHKYRYFYFLGRTLSFTLAGLLAGGLGTVLHHFLQIYHFSALSSFLFGGLIFSIGVLSLTGRQFSMPQWFSKPLARFNRTLSLLMLKDQAWPAFLFGFFTITLPCGQTLVVFSACALSGDFFVGMSNGLAFALLTSPSLFAAMHVHAFFPAIKSRYNILMGIFSILIGSLTICRGLAEMEVISHIGMNIGATHIAIF